MDGQDVDPCVLRDNIPFNKSRKPWQKKISLLNIQAVMDNCCMVIGAAI